MSDDIKDFLTKNYSYIFDQDTKSSDIDSIEKIIKHVENYYLTIIGSMPGNVYWCDKNANAIGCNQNVLNFMQLGTVEEFRGLSFEKTGEITDWSDSAVSSFKKDSLEVIESGKAKFNIEEPPIPDQHGNDILFLTSRAPIFNSHNKVIGMVGVSIDITERKKIETALKKAKIAAETANQARSEFIANMSHDIKTPLAGIIGMADLLTNQLTEENDIHCARDIIAAGQQLMTFFDNCFEIVKAEDENTVPLSENFNLRKIIQQIIHLFQPSAANKKLKLSVYYDDKLPDYLLGNGTHLYRILINLVGNAIKFTETGSVSISVKLGAKSTDKKIIVLITIKDTGIGISKDKHAYIFERFTRLTQSNKGFNTGSGLGLYLVKKYLDTMGGEIHLISAENQGSQFIVAIPFEISLLDSSEHENMFHLQNELPIEKPRLTKAAFTRPVSTELARILLVEDDLIAQTVVRTILTSLHCKVDVAANGKEAIELFEAGKYKLVFTDLGLPDIDGYNIISYFRTVEKDAACLTPIIILTAHITNEIRTQCLQLKTNEILHKPLLGEKAKLILEKYVFQQSSLTAT